MILRRPPDDDGERTTVWLLGEGDRLRGGAEVLHLQRDPVARTVRILTTHQPTGVTLPADQPVVVVLRAH